jgi:hypothetical protein
MPATTHPLAQLCTFELQAYRRDLEAAMADVAPDTLAHADLRHQLDALAVEEYDRRRIASGR